MNATEEKLQQINGIVKSASSVIDGLGVNDSGTFQKSDPPVTQPRSPDVPARKFADFSVESDTWGHTYFVRRGDAIKIGHSAIPRQRIGSLQVGFPEPLEVWAVVPNTIIGEGAAHKRFAHLRLSGEWFRAAPDLLEFIEQAKAEADKMPKRKIPKPPPEGFSRARHHLARLRPHCPPAAQPHISVLISQLGNYESNPEALRRQILKSVERIEQLI